MEYVMAVEFATPIRVVRALEWRGNDPEIFRMITGGGF